jgi:glycerol-3-phosphate acyltransferase PlsY
MIWFVPVAVILAGYLIGSLPTGYIVGRMAGVDIRTQGSGNIGATNVVRVLGKKYGYPVFLIDLLKGVVAVVVAQTISTRANSPLSMQLLAIIGGVACVVGHNFPVWLGFHGGKGVATSVGVVFALLPAAAIAVLAVWILTFSASRYVSLASIVAAIALPIIVGLLYLHQPGGILLIGFSVLLTLLILARHRSNVVRLIKGTEPRFHRR